MKSRIAAILLIMALLGCRNQDPRAHGLDLPAVTADDPGPAGTAQASGSTSANPVDGAILVFVPEGEFLMGSAGGDSDELPIHNVYLGSFWIYQTEVTNIMYAAFLNAAGNQIEGGAAWLDAGDGDAQIYLDGGIWLVERAYGDHPAIEISWFGAAAYCRWAGGRLPSEAEWEKAARGTAGNSYPWGNQWDSGRANASGSGDGYSSTSPVMAFPQGASPYGALDMSGNVWEWVGDWYDREYYRNSSAENPAGPSNGRLRVLRGGSWHIAAEYLRAANRHFHTPEISHDVIGFRCAVPTWP